MKLKYVILDEAYPVLFGECHRHSDFASVGRVTSAGFCSIHEVEDKSEMALTPTKQQVTCWGNSTSTGAKSQPRDASIIERLFQP